MSTNFSAWIEQADMPEQQNGVWVDLETGIRYNPEWDYAANRARAARRQLSTKAQNARAIAKFFGGKALTGTAKQKEWAEKIRAEKLARMNAEQAEVVCDPTSLCRSAHFWIENRNKDANQFAAFVEQYRAIARRCDAHRKAGDQAALSADAAKYNALTAAWGFTA